MTERGSGSWRVVNSVSDWLTPVSPAQEYTGTATVEFSMDFNSSPRVGGLTVAGKAVSLIQGLKVFTVTNPGDSGLGTLRQAIQDSNPSNAENHVLFNLPGDPP